MIKVAGAHQIQGCPDMLFGIFGRGLSRLTGTGGECQHNTQGKNNRQYAFHEFHGAILLLSKTHPAPAPCAAGLL